MTHHRRVVNAEKAPAPAGPYAHGVVSNGLLFCSGQIPSEPDTGELAEGDVATQARRCLENLAKVCEAAGARIDDAVRLTLYLADLPGDMPAVNEAYGEFFSSRGDADPPARVAIGVAALPRGARVAVDAVVALPD